MRPLLARILPLPLYSLSSVFVTGCYPLLSRIIGSFLSFLHSAPLRLRSIRFPIDVGYAAEERRVLSCPFLHF